MYGNVYAAPDEGTAYKLSDDEFTSARELHLLSRIEHPNVIAVLGCGMATPAQKDVYPKACAWFAMARASTDLFQIMCRRSRLPCADPRWSRSIAAQLSAAVAAVHAAGVIHRDIKPGNVLVTDRQYNTPHVTLCDFGLARCALRHSNVRCNPDGTDVGITGSVQTIWYRSPEVSARMPYGYAADVWSLGMVLYELFSRGAQGSSQALLQASSDAGGCCDSRLTKSLRQGHIDPETAVMTSALNPHGMLGTAARAGVLDRASEARAREVARCKARYSPVERREAAMILLATVVARDVSDEFVHAEPLRTRYQQGLARMEEVESRAVRGCLHALPMDRFTASALCELLGTDAPCPPASRLCECATPKCLRYPIYFAAHSANAEATRRALMVGR